MDKTLVETIKEDFLAWSGGFPPESDYQIFVYIETAKPVDINDTELGDMLRVWMNEDEPINPNA